MEQGLEDCWSAGVLAVVRSHPEWERPYTGIVELQSGEIAEDLAKYLVESEQQNAAIALGVSIGRDGSIRSAGGFLLQVYTWNGASSQSCYLETCFSLKLFKLNNILAIRFHQEEPCACK